MIPPSPARPAGADPFLQLALTIVAVAGRVVPDVERRAWRSEWHAELITRDRETRRRGAPGLGARMGLVARALGAVPDAWFLLTRGFSVGHVLADLRIAARSLRKRPGFTTVAVLTLGIGIGANTALFSVVRGVLLRPLGYADPDRLVQLRGIQIDDLDEFGNVSYPNLADIEARATTLSGVAGLTGWQPALTGDETRVVVGATVSWDYFDVLGVRPAVGRFFVSEEEGEGREPVVVIGHDLWTRFFGADPGLVGRTISVNHESYRVAGVAPRRFEGARLVEFEGSEPEIWRTPWFDAADWFRSGRSWHAVARLSDGASLEAAQADVSAIMTELAETFPEENARRDVRLVPLRESVVGETRSALLLLFAAVGLVLLVACVNLANLLLNRALDRYDELRVRAALGATHGRLVAHLLAESVGLAALGCVLGIGVAIAGVRAIVRLAGPWIPRPDAIAVDGLALAFAAGCALLCALLFGLLPGLRVVRGARIAATGASRAGGALGRRTGRLRNALVLSEIATTVVLTCGAGLLGKSLWNLNRVDLGVERRGALALSLHGAAWSDLEPDVAAARYRAIFARTTALPGVEAAGAIDVVPLSDNYSCDGVTPTDRPPPAPGEGRCAEVRSVTPGILEALGVGLVAGRGIDWRDGPGAPRSAMFTRRAAAMFWPGEDAIGKRAVIHSDTFTVVGVATDVRHFGPADPVAPMVLLPAAQEPWNGIARGLTLVVRRAPGAGPGAPQIVSAVREAAGPIPIGDVRTLDELLSNRLGGSRFRAVLLGGFAGLALLLALVGISGVMAYAVTRRARELGIRIALGAAPGRVVRGVVASGARLTAAGLAFGLLGALALTRVLRAFVFEVSTLDPIVLGGACASVALLALLACWLPARRAARIDPVRVLRTD